MKTSEARPITEITLGVIDQNAAVKLGEKLKKEKCRVTYVSKGHYYLVHLPSGSTEGACTNSDPRYREETTIKFPNGATIRKCVKWPCTQPGCTHTYIFLPDELEETPLRRRLQNEAR